MESNRVGRPTVLTLDTVAKLVSVLQRGISITKACVYAHIDRASFYRKYNEDMEFRNRIDDARNFATVVAAEVVVDDIIKHRNVQTAKWYLERKDSDEFGLKQKVSVNGREEKESLFMSTAQIKQLFATPAGDQIGYPELLEALEDSV